MRGNTPPLPPNRYLICSGHIASIGALIHLSTIFGGPSWYRAIGAPETIAQMAANGRSYPVLACLLIATVLFSWAGYAYSGAGLMRRFPFLRTALTLIATLLIVRGISFIPLMLWRPAWLAGIYRGHSVDGFLVASSAICLATGIAYALGTRQVWRSASIKLR